MKTVMVSAIARSGTSLTTGLLYRLGFYIGDDPAAGDKYNETGYWESRKMINLNIYLRQLIGGGGHDYPAGKLEKALSKRLGIDMDFFKKFQTRNATFKVFPELIPLFLPHFDKNEVYVIVTLRKPESLVKSHENFWKNKFNLLKSYKLLSESLYNLFYVIKKYDLPFLIMDYDLTISNPEKTVKDLISFLDIEVSEGDFKNAVSFVIGSLRHF